MPADEKRPVDASHQVLMEVVHVLGAYLGQSVIVGGWVPQLYFPGDGHIGSLDVDLALDGQKIQPAAYGTIKDHGKDRDVVARDAFERSQVFLKTTGMLPTGTDTT